MLLKQIIISNYRQDQTAHAFLEFYLQLFRSGELDTLSTRDPQHQIIDINLFLIDVSSSTQEELLDTLVAHEQAELQALYHELAEHDPHINELRTLADWQNWYRQMTADIAVKTAGSSWNHVQTR